MSADPTITGLVDADLMAAFPPAGDADWRALVETALKGRDFDKVLRSSTRDGFALHPLYGQSDEAGVRVARLQNGPWSISQRVDHPDAEQASDFVLADLEGGADGLTLVSAQAASANGFGVALDAVSLGKVLDNVLLDIIRLRLDAGPGCRDVLPVLTEIARSKDLAVEQVQLDPGFDPAADLANGLLDAMPLSAHGVALKDMAGFGFGGTIATADGRIAGDAGASDSQELAVVLAGLLGHLRAAEAAGLDLDAIAGRLEAIVTAGPDIFASLTKMRAARMLFARLLDSAGITGRPLRLHTETAWAHVSATDPYVNMLRATSAVAGAGLGGADSILTQPLTAALGLADGFSRRMARNIQLVLIEESFLDKVSDPAAGAGYLDQRATALSEAAWGIFQQVESACGLQNALKSGFVGDMIAGARTALETDLACRVAPLTGVTEFASATERLPDVLEVSPQSANRKASLLPRIRWSESFEALRVRGMKIEGDKPAVFLAAIGALPEFNARATFARNAYAIAGLECAMGEGGTEIEIIVTEAKASGARLVCLTASDDGYAAHGVELAKALTKAGFGAVHLAGKPDAALQGAGVTTGPAMRGDVVKLLSDTLDQLGV